MFCPLAVDYGNVADWASGVGSLAAVIAALWVAGSQARAAARVRVAEEAERVQRRAQVVAEAIRLAGEVEAKATSRAQLARLGGANSASDTVELMEEIASVRSQIEALQKFPMTDPRVFSEIGRLAHDCRFERGLAVHGSAYVEMAMRRTAERMRERRDALSSL